jgi:hypothetical protein
MCPIILAERRFHATGDVGTLTSTSGTTGVPKIVEWPLAATVMTSKCRVDIWKLTPNDVTMAVATFAGGAAGTLTYFAAPLVGAKIVILEEFTPDFGRRKLFGLRCFAFPLSHRLFSNDPFAGSSVLEISICRLFASITNGASLAA